jgi:pimeloyl-ACP methyl ester carboxylesterase
MQSGMIRGYCATPLGQIHYRAVRTGDPVVLLPQSGRSSEMYLNLMRELAGRYHVVALDMPGSGGSSDLPAATPYEAIAASFIEAIDGLGIGPVNLYGLHTGNKIGTAMAAAAPERFRRFVFAGQSHSIIPDQQARNAAIAGTVADVVAPRSQAGQAALFDWTTKLSEIAALGLSRTTLSGIIETAGYDESLERIIDELQAMRSRPLLYAGNFAYDLGRDLARLRVPTLILEIATPEEDCEFGRQGEALLALIPSATLVTHHEPGGHGLTMEHRAPEIAAIVSRFFG